MKKFIDTAPLIYLIEDHPEFAEKVIDLLSEFFNQEDLNGNRLVTSVITLLEFGVKPEKENRQDVIQKFNELLIQIRMEILDVGKADAIKAYQLRAKYSFLKSMDAIQIASAINSGCKEFITNDKKLKKVEEILVVLL